MLMRRVVVCQMDATLLSHCDSFRLMEVCGERILASNKIDFSRNLNCQVELSLS